MHQCLTTRQQAGADPWCMCVCVCGGVAREASPPNGNCSPGAFGAGTPIFISSRRVSQPGVYFCIEVPGVQVKSLLKFYLIIFTLNITFPKMRHHSIDNEMAKQIHYVVGHSDSWLSISSVYSKRPRLNSLARGHRRQTDCPRICETVCEWGYRVR